MKQTIIFILSFLLTSSVFGQGLIEKYPVVQNEKSLIDQNDSLITIYFENEEFLEKVTDGGGELRGLYDTNGSVRKIEVIVFLSYGIQEYEFYTIDEIPFLIEDQFKRFAWNEETGNFDYSQFDGGFQGTYIFQNGHLIDQLSLGHNRFENDEIDIEQLFMTEYENYLDKIKKRLANKGYKQ